MESSKEAVRMSLNIQPMMIRLRQGPLSLSNDLISKKRSCSNMCREDYDKGKE